MITRRHFLRAAGVCLALPPLESLASPRISKAPRRFIAINNTLGFHLPHLIPDSAGRDYEDTRYLRILRRHRPDFTLISGLHFHEVDGGHSAEKSFLSAAPHPGNPTFKPTPSIDQLIATSHTGQTRLPSLNLRTTNDQGNNMSYGPDGQPTPVEDDPTRIYASMFLLPGDDDTEAVMARLRKDHSVLDHVLDDARRLSQRVTAADRDRVDSYFTALRAVEKNLHRREAWAAKPKPAVDYRLPSPPPDANDIVALAKLHLDLCALALLTDSTRSIALKIFGTGARPPIEGLDDGYHGLSHHGQDPAKIDQLARIEEAILHVLADFLDQLASARDPDGTRLLDHTTVLIGSNLGNASSHDNRQLPILLAGAGLRHGSHLRHDPADPKAPDLCNLYLSLLHLHGVESERFAASTGTYPLPV